MNNNNNLSRSAARFLVLPLAALLAVVIVVHAIQIAKGPATPIIANPLADPTVHEDTDAQLVGLEQVNILREEVLSLRDELASVRHDLYNTMFDLNSLKQRCETPVYYMDVKLRGDIKSPDHSGLILEAESSTKL